MNLSVSHIRLTDSMRTSLNKIEFLDKQFCKFKGYDFSNLYGELTVTGYIEDVLCREVVHLLALCEYYGLETNSQLVGSEDPEASENAEHEPTRLLYLDN